MDAISNMGPEDGSLGIKEGDLGLKITFKKGPVF